MYSQLLSILLILPSITSALTFTSPTTNSTIDPTHAWTVTWTTTNGDPKLIDLYLNSDATSAGGIATLGTNVAVSDLKFTVQAGIVNLTGTGYQVTADTPGNMGNSFVAQGRLFAFDEGNKGGQAVNNPNNMASSSGASTSASATAASESASGSGNGSATVAGTAAGSMSTTQTGTATGSAPASTSSSAAGGVVNLEPGRGGIVAVAAAAGVGTLVMALLL